MTWKEGRRKFLVSLGPTGFRHSRIVSQCPANCAFYHNYERPQRFKNDPPTTTLWSAKTETPGSSHRLASGLFEDYLPIGHLSGDSIAFVSYQLGPEIQRAPYVLNLRDGIPEGRALLICQCGSRGKDIKPEFPAGWRE